MAINNQAALLNFQAQQGAGNIVANNGSGQANHEKAEFWINVGHMMTTDKLDDQGQPVQVFVQLPFGIPLETPETLKAKKIYMNEDKLKFLAYMTKLGESLKPGETKFVGGKATGLLLQLRRADFNKPAAVDNSAPLTLDIGVF